MRKRLLTFLACLMIVPALLAAGCGDDNSDSTPAQDSSGQTAATSDTSATKSAKATLDSCLEAADTIPSEAAAEKAKQQCQDSYDNIKEGAEKIDEKTDEAVEKCKEAAESIPDAQTKADAIAACEKFN